MFFLLSVFLLYACIGNVGLAGEYVYPTISLKRNGAEITLTQGDKLFHFPPHKTDYAGIRKVVKEDVDGDGTKEYILAVQLEGVTVGDPDGKSEELPGFPNAWVLICKPAGKKLKISQRFYVGDVLPDFELADVNKDGLQDVIATGASLIGWIHLTIGAYQKGKYVQLWHNRGHDDSESVFQFPEQSFSVNKKGNAEITVGISRNLSDKPQLLEKWVWNGKKFALNSKGAIRKRHLEIAAT